MKDEIRKVFGVKFQLMQALRGEEKFLMLIFVYISLVGNVLGEECTFLHRIPGIEDERRLDATYDIFGRERHRTDREDMGGVGSFSRDNRTLYIGGLRKISGVNLEQLVWEQFSEWGEIENVRVIFSKNIAFVTYKMRSSAEFAKEAMADQGMGHQEVLNVRWANEDPNPAVQAKKEYDTQQKAVGAIINKYGYDYANAYQYDQYPNTDSQFAGYNPSASSTTSSDPSAYEYSEQETQEYYTDGSYVYDPYGQDYLDPNDPNSHDAAERELLSLAAETSFPSTTTTATATATATASAQSLPSVASTSSEKIGSVSEKRPVPQEEGVDNEQPQKKLKVT